MERLRNHLHEEQNGVVLLLYYHKRVVTCKLDLYIDSIQRSIYSIRVYYQCSIKWWDAGPHLAYKLVFRRLRRPVIWKTY